jgi:hypothetical protein
MHWLKRRLFAVQEPSVLFFVSRASYGLMLTIFHALKCTTGLLVSYFLSVLDWVRAFI